MPGFFSDKQWQTDPKKLGAATGVMIRLAAGAILFFGHQGNLCDGGIVKSIENGQIDIFGNEPIVFEVKQEIGFGIRPQPFDRRAKGRRFGCKDKWIRKMALH